MVSTLVFRSSAKDGCTRNRRNLAGSLKTGSGWGCLLLLAAMNIFIDCRRNAAVRPGIGTGGLDLIIGKMSDYWVK